MSENSPAPYNPADRIKRHLKRKSSSRALAPVFDAFTRPVFQEPTTESCPGHISTHSNPFKIGSPLKKRRPPAQSSSQFEWDDENAMDQFTSAPVRTSPRKRATPKKSPKKSPMKKRTSFSRLKSFDANSLLKEYHATDFSELLGGSAKSEKVVEVKESPNPPKDLRLGTKMRISSNVPFPWMKNRSKTGIVAVRIPANERYEGLKYFMDSVANGGDKTSGNVSPMAQIEAATLFWQFPVLPAVSMYPRIHGLQKNSQRVPMASVVLESVNNQWVEAFEQLFISWKKGDRRDFYVATAAFNVLFMKVDESENIDVTEDSRSCFQTGGQKMIALVSHTTSAVREILRNEGVEYEIAGKMKKIASSGSFSNLAQLAESNQGPPESTENLEEDDFDLEEDEQVSDENESPTKANQKWLKDLGVSPRNVMKSMTKRRLGPQANGGGNGVECLLVKGPSVQALYNMLQTSSLVHETTGPYMKVPPTLLADSPFLFGQLLSLNKTSHVVQKAGKCLEYVLELDNGPILPHAVDLMAKGLRCGGFCGGEDGATVRVNDRYANNGMNTPTELLQDWTAINIHENVVKWT